MQPYTDTYFDTIRSGSQRSAQTIVPLVLQWMQPLSVVDVGCGVGTWLRVFQAMGIRDILGVDGAYVEVDQLEIQDTHFLARNLEEPLYLDRTFDLVVSLEVAEHLTPPCAEEFIASLIRLGPVVLFSAAIPFQGGAHHVNEQWPAYWAAHFEKHGFQAIDCLRSLIWDCEEVDWWYAQNIFLYASQEGLARWPSLRQTANRNVAEVLSLVHPKNYMNAIWRERVAQAEGEIVSLIPPGETFILVDQDQFGSVSVPGRRAVPFLERDGSYAGLPADDEEALHELQRLAEAGARYLVVAWPAFWWLDHYNGLSHHLDATAARLVQSKHVIVYDLQGEK